MARRAIAVEGCYEVDEPEVSRALHRAQNGYLVVSCREPLTVTKVHFTGIPHIKRAKELMKKVTPEGNDIIDVMHKLAGASEEIGWIRWPKKDRKELRG